MRLLIFSLPFLALAATLAQGIRAMTVRVPAPYQSAPSTLMLATARAEVEALHARQLQDSSSPYQLAEAQPIAIQLP